MSDKDVSAATYFEDPVHCADLLNGFTFHGKQYILPEHIQIQNQNSALPNTKDKNNRNISIYRDIVINTKIQMKTTIITIENQSDIHYAMPVRVMAGDSANYHTQWRKKDMLDLERLPQEMIDFIGDYPIQLLEVCPKILFSLLIIIPILENYLKPKNSTRKRQGEWICVKRLKI